MEKVCAFRCGDGMLIPVSVIIRETGWVVRVPLALLPITREEDGEEFNGRGAESGRPCCAAAPAALVRDATSAAAAEALSGIVPTWDG